MGGVRNNSLKMKGRGSSENPYRDILDFEKEKENIKKHFISISIYRFVT